jgi:signal transduction histidine kinase/ActR/RegA family two-component response regulator
VSTPDRNRVIHLPSDPASVHDAADEAALRREVDDECMRLSYGHMLYVTLATTAIVVVMAAMMRGRVPPAALAAWVAVYFLVSLVRLYVALWYRRRPRTGDELRRKLPLLALGLLLAPLAWSALPFLTPREDTLAYMIQALFTGGLTAAGAQTLIGTPRILLANTLLIMAPLTGLLLASGIEEQVYMGWLGIFYYLCMVYFGRRNLAVIRESVTLRLRNQHLVQALTLARDQAEQARDAAERANEAKNRFLAAASHDIRQPLHAAQLFVGALRHDARTRELPAVGRFQAALAAARQMLDTLLDVSLLDAGVVRRSDADFRAETIGQPLIEMFDPVAARKGVALGLRCPPELWLHSDPALVQRVLVNLVGNAVKYTERGAVLIAFRRRGRSCLVQVWDTGVGIAEQHRESIFDEFTQLANPQRDRSRGTGLGLTIVRRLCRLLGTEVMLRSTPGRGSVFGFRLPMGQPAADEPRAASTAEAPAARATVLVVDDDALVRDGLVELLTAQGYSVRTAADADEAGRVAAEGSPPDLVLVDYRLPGEKTALDAIRAICASAHHAVPAIVVTGDTHPQRIREAQALGHPVLFKPVPADALLDALGKALSQPA